MVRSLRGKIRFFLVPVFGLFLALIAVFLCDRKIEGATLSLHSNDPGDLPECEVALVLGCAETLANGRKNRYFTARIEAAALLFRSGKCRSFIVSGDNSRKDYDEPARMTVALVEMGVPENRIYRDYAGFRTLDSVIRAKHIFGQSEVIVVSQRFHNERAIYIGLQRGLVMHGLNAKDVSLKAGLKTRIREKAARLKTMLDLYVLQTGPRFYGPPVAIEGTEEFRKTLP